MNKQQYLAMPVPVVTAANAAIIEAVKAAGFVVKDEHDPKGERTLALAGVCVYQRGERQEVIALFNKNFSDYYCLNSIALYKDGTVAVTRDNCAGIINPASNDPKADLEAIIDGINWEAVEKYPSLVPGQYFNIVLKEAA